MKTRTFDLFNKKYFLRLTKTYIAFGIIDPKYVTSVMLKIITDKPFSIGSFSIGVGNAIYWIGPLWVSIKFIKGDVLWILRT